MYCFKMKNLIFMFLKKKFSLDKEIHSCENFSDFMIGNLAFRMIVLKNEFFEIVSFHSYKI